MKETMSKNQIDNEKNYVPSLFDFLTVYDIVVNFNPSDDKRRRIHNRVEHKTCLIWSINPRERVCCLNDASLDNEF